MTRNILQILEILTYLYCFASLYGQKMKYNIYTVVFTVLQLVLMEGINEYGFPQYLVSLSYILMFVYCILNYKKTIRYALINCAISVILVGVMQLLFYMGISLFYIDNYSDNQLIVELLISIMCYVVVRLLYRKVQLIKISEFFAKRDKLLLAIGIFVLLALGSQIWEMKQKQVLRAEICVPIVYFILLFSILIWEWQKSKTDAERRTIQLEMNSLYYSGYENLIQSVREKQYDFKNHINAIYGMLFSINDYQKLVDSERKYIETIMTQLEPISLLTLVENPLIAGFLSEKIQSIKNKEIPIRWDCKLKETSLTIPEYCMVEMMGILIDNAFDEAQLLGNDAEINVELSEDDDHIKFLVCNTCTENALQNMSQFFVPGYSSKGKNRGIGLTKLKNMTGRVNGKIIISEGTIRDKKAINMGIYIPK